MGRIKKYLTPEDKKQAKADASKRYYWKNKEQEDEKARQRYYKKRMPNMQ
jgi:hypothetical protein